MQFSLHKVTTKATMLLNRVKPDKQEYGFTLIELLITIAILGTMTGVMSMSIVAMYRIVPQNNDYARAYQQAQNAGYWIASDAKMARDIDSSPAAPEFLEFTIPVSPNDADDKTVIYEFEDMEGGMKRLFRSDSGTGARILIAEHIYYDPVGDPADSTLVVEHDTDNRTLEVQITAKSGDILVKRIYEASQRVDDSE